MRRSGLPPRRTEGSEPSVDDPAPLRVVVAQRQVELLGRAVGHPQPAGDEESGVVARADRSRALHHSSSGVAAAEQLAGPGAICRERLVENLGVPRCKGVENQPCRPAGVDARKAGGRRLGLGWLPPGDALGKCGERCSVERGVVLDAVNLEQRPFPSVGREEGDASTQQPLACGVEAVFSARVALGDGGVAHVVALAEIALCRAVDRQAKGIPLAAQRVARAVVRAGELLLERE